MIDDHTEARLAEEAQAHGPRPPSARFGDVFGRFVARGVVERLLEDPDRIHLGGERQEITVLFGDIRGYTTISEGSSRSGWSPCSNLYLGVATEAIFANEGTLDKYIGDAVMALFNTPLPQPHARLRRAADRADDAAGDQAVGRPVGCPDRLWDRRRHRAGRWWATSAPSSSMNYTAIGDAVNVAARLQSNAPPGEVLFSASTYELVAGRVEAERLEPLAVKGRQQLVEAYRLVDA